MLRDLLRRNLDLVICGMGVGARSAEIGQYYAIPGNRFWPTLADVGLTLEQLAPHQHERLLASRIGLTDLVKRDAGNDRDLRLTPADRLALPAKNHALPAVVRLLQRQARSKKNS